MISIVLGGFGPITFSFFRATAGTVVMSSGTHASSLCPKYLVSFYPVRALSYMLKEINGDTTQETFGCSARCIVVYIVKSTNREDYDLSMQVF